MESFDMLVALTLAAAFLFGVYAMMAYFPQATASVEAKAAVMLDAQEVLKKIITSPGSPPDWDHINEIVDMGLADSQIQQLDPRKILALATLSNFNYERICRIKTKGPKSEHPLVTRIGYGAYIWGVSEQRAVDPDVYRRVLKSLFGEDWDKYDIELVIEPALNIKLQYNPPILQIQIHPPGKYQFDLIVLQQQEETQPTQPPPQNNPPPQIELVGYKRDDKNKNRWLVYVKNSGGASATIQNITIVGTRQGKGKSDLVQCLHNQQYQVERGETCFIQINCQIDEVNSISINGISFEAKQYSGQALECTRKSGGGGGGSKSAGGSQGSEGSSSVRDWFRPYSSETDERSGSRAVGVGHVAFAMVYVRGVAVRGLNYTYIAGSGEVSNIGAVVRPDKGVYIIHGGRIEEWDSNDICGGSFGGTGGLNYDVSAFVGGQTRVLISMADINPGVTFDPENPEICEGNKEGPGGGNKATLDCLIPWSVIGRAKFLIITSRMTGGGNKMPKSDVVVVPLAGGLPPLWRVEFATWRRWVDRRPEALAVSYAEALADGGEITYLVRLWVYRYR